MAAESVEPRTARSMQRAGDVIIDVRLPTEYAHEHVAGAINIPIETLDPDALPPGQLITTCTHGGRAARAAALLDAAGRAAFFVEGGTSAWREIGLPVRRGDLP